MQHTFFFSVMRLILFSTQITMLLQVIVIYKYILPCRLIILNVL